LSDGSYHGPKPIWQDPVNWKPWCQFVGAEYFFGFLGFVLVCACIWHVQIEGALIVIVFTALGICFYRRKHAKGKKKWEKHRDPVAYKENKKNKGLKGLKNKVAGGGGGGGGSDASSDLLGGGASSYLHTACIRRR
jgi:hypothetical protein